MRNDLSILPRVDEAIATDYRDGRSDHDVVTALAQAHPAYLSRFYAEHPVQFREEADRSYGPRAERLRDKLASLS